jgi:hypothetical protein
MSDFADCLYEMRNHYKTNAAEGRSTHYVPSERFAKKFQASNLVGLSADDQQIVEGLQKLGQDTGQEDADYNQQAIAARTEELKGAGNTPAAQKTFKEQMEEQKKRAKDNAAQNIDKIYDEAIRIGEENPSAQGAIVSTMDVLSNLWDSLVTKIVDFVKDIVNKFVEWVKNAWESITSTFNAIGSWISGWFGFRLAPA